MPLETLTADLGSLSLLAVLVAVFLCLAGLLGRFIRPRKIYFRRPRLLSAAELQFFHTLETVVGDQFCLLAKVRVADLVDVRGVYGREWWTAFARVSQKHVDFLVASRQTVEVLVAIELDDSSHLKGSRCQRDDLLNAVFMQAGIPLIRFSLDYSTADVRDALCEAVQLLRTSRAPAETTSRT
jgi:hypothetical protein